MKNLAFYLFLLWTWLVQFNRRLARGSGYYEERIENGCIFFRSQRKSCACWASRAVGKKRFRNYFLKKRKIIFFLICNWKTEICVRCRSDWIWKKSIVACFVRCWADCYEFANSKLVISSAIALLLLFFYYYFIFL